MSQNLDIRGGTWTRADLERALEPRRHWPDCVPPDERRARDAAVRAFAEETLRLLDAAEIRAGAACTAWVASGTVFKFESLERERERSA